MSLKPPVSPNTLLDYRHVYDEGTQQNAEDGINFTGAGVTVTDDPTNHRLNVTIPGGTGTGGEPYTTVDSLSATPRSVTDWGPLLNTAIAAGTRRFLFGPFDYPFATTIVTRNGSDGVTFEGAASGWTWSDPGQNGRTRLIWNGTGATTAIDCTSTLNTCAFRDLHILYSSGSFTGVLIDFFHSADASVIRCTFAYVNSNSSFTTVTSAKAAVSLNEIVESSFESCYFAADFQTGVRGRESGVGNYAQGAYFSECVFNGGVLAMVMNPGEDWVFRSCTFEFPLLGNGKAAIGQDFNYGGDFPTNGAQLSVYDSSWWDAQNGAGQMAVQTRAGNDMSFIAVSCRDHCITHNLAYLYDLKSHGAVVILGGNAQNKINFGDATVAAQKKGLIEVTGLDMSGNADANTFVGQNTGHHVVNISAGWDAQLPGQVGQSVTVHHESAHRIDQPTIISHTGVLNQTVVIRGNDMAGFILIQNTAGVAGPTGLLADVTLANPPASPGFGPGVSGGNKLPVVMTSVFKPDDAGGDFPTPNTATTYTCQPWGYAKSLSSGGSQAAFSIGVNVGIPAGGVIGVAYRVIHL